MTDETTPTSSPSLASGFTPVPTVRDPKCECHPIKGVGLAMDGSPFCRIHDVQVPWTPEEWAAEQAAKDKAIDERALEAAEAMLWSGWINEEASQATREETVVEIAAVLRPFFAKQG